jgi:hypothetical protein
MVTQPDIGDDRSGNHTETSSPADADTPGPYPRRRAAPDFCPNLVK